VKLKAIRRIEAKPARCISVDAEDRLFAAGGDDGRSVLTHNSVIQRNIILGCILRPDSWRFIGIDLKKVELSSFRAYSNVVLGIATELEDALTVLRFGQATMMKRYQEMEAVGENDFINMPDHGPALMIMVDEAGELLSASGIKTDEGKHDDELKGEAQMIIGSVARLGRAAGVHLVIATQRPDATLIPGETKANLGCRINAGRTDSNASNMILGSGEGTRVKPFPPGRLYIRIYSSGDHGQGFFAKPDWIDKYLKEQGLNQDGTPLAQGKQNTRKANLVDMESFGDGDLDSREGIDTQGAIERYQSGEGEENENEGDDDFSFEDEDDGAFGFEDVDEEKPAAPQKPTAPGDMSAPINFGEKKEKSDRFARPEEDWDASLDELIDENFK
jgi:hypothetical protein